MKTNDEKKDKRLTLRLTARDFDAMEAKCFEQRTTFQAIGAQLIADWAKPKEGETQLSVEPEHAPTYELLKAVLESENDFVKESVTTMLRHSAYLSLLAEHKTGDMMSRDIAAMIQRKATKVATERPAKQRA